LPKLRDPAVLESAIAEGVSSADPQFGYADRFDESSGKYEGLVCGRLAPTRFSQDAVIVRKEVAAVYAGQSENSVVGSPPPTGEVPIVSGPVAAGPTTVKGATRSKRFYGSVEIDMIRPVKAFDAILNAIVMELQRTQGTKVKLTLEIEAVADEGFSDNDVSVVRDNARQLKFKPESTGFED
jgi:hypothetical protein